MRHNHAVCLERMNIICSGNCHIFIGLKVAASDMIISLSHPSLAPTHFLIITKAERSEKVRFVW